MRFAWQTLLPLLLLLVSPCLARTAPHRESDREASDWIMAARQTHAKFTGQRGTFAQFGDSITVTNAFWAPLLSPHKNAPPAMEKAFQAVKAYLRPECWRDWKGPEYGSEGGQTSRWALEHIGEWLKKLNPEVALILFGSNDLHSLDLEEYRSRMRALVQKCQENGTVVILSTLPPRHGFERKAAEFAEAVRQIAQERRVPLTDFYAEILQRRPKDWDGALDVFQQYEGYEVPTLISRDGVHPSYPTRYQNDYSEEGLNRSGYTLRNYLALMKYAEVIRALHADASAQDTPMASQFEALRPPVQPWFPKAPPLPLTGKETVRVANVPELLRAVEQVKPGGTILLADGLYKLAQPIEIRADSVTLRSASGHRERVVLDGGNQGELIRLTACSSVTIAHLTVQNVQWNGIKLNSETGVHKALIYDCILHNIWQRAVKGTIVPPANREKLRPTGCRVQFCLFYNDHPKRFADDPADTAQNFNGNYIGGIDVMFARDWVISDNVFIGIHGRTGEARGAVFLWNDTAGCIIERNIILDCDSGICLGNSSRGEGVTLHCTRCIVRNNFVTRAHENGILADYTRACKLLNNTIYDPDSRLGRLIRLVHDNDGLLVANNLVCGPKIRIESESQITFVGNLEQDLSAALVAPMEGNLRLTPRAVEAIDRAVPQPDVQEDIDRTPRTDKPDIGAHELTGG